MEIVALPMTKEKRNADEKSAHPGRIVRHDCLEPLGLSVTEGAEVLGVSRQTLNNVIHGKSGISPEMAIRLSKAFGSTPETWLRMQLAYDLALARKDESKIKVRRVAVPRNSRPVRPLPMSLFQVIVLADCARVGGTAACSSSAHVVVAEKVMGLDPSSPPMTLLLVMLHTGTMFAVIVYFWRQWRELTSRVEPLSRSPRVSLS